MKTRIPLLISILLVLSTVMTGFSEGLVSASEAKANSLNIYSSPEMFKITTLWAEEYEKANPGITCEVIMTQPGLTGPIMAENLIFLSQSQLPEETPGFLMTVGREVIVPIVNTGNPLMNELNGKGVSRDMLINLFLEPSSQSWGTLLKNNQDVPVHLYLSNDKIVISSLEQYLGISVGNIASEDELKLLSDLRNDPNAMGFCRLTSVLDFETQKLSEGVCLLPIDKNNNGKLDYIENFYSNPDEFLRAVWIGKYPKALSNEIFAMSGSQPSDAAQVAFLKWIITNGQQFLAGYGMSGLVYSEVQSKLDRLNEGIITKIPENNAYSTPKLVLFILAVALVLSIMIGAIAGYGRGKKLAAPLPAIDMSPGFDDHTVIVPKGLFYDRTHTWAFMEKDGAVKIGIDDFLQHVTGNFTRVVVKKEGDKIKKGEPLVSLVQKGKQLTLYSPVTGTIRENNTALTDNPGLLNSSPYIDGWIYRVEPSNWFREMSLLNMAGKYTKWLNDEMIKLKDFLAFPSQPQQLQYLKILQDGGLLKNHVLEEMGPEVWEDFQTKFLDANK